MTSIDHFNGTELDTIVLEGALETRGMVGFSSWLKPDEVDAIRAFVAK